jgi:hypothetical protein
LIRSEIAGNPDADKKSDAHPHHIIKEQPAGIADYILQVMASFNPGPDEQGQMFNPFRVHFFGQKKSE